MERQRHRGPQLDEVKKPLASPSGEKLPPGDSATAAENAAHLLALQTWVAAECAAGRAPVFGNADPARETLRAEQGKLERADAGGTAVYSLRIRAEYTQLYTEETP